MRIDLYPLGNNISIRDIDYQCNRTHFSVNLKFQTEDKTYYIAQQIVDVHAWDEDLDDENINSVSYSEIEFSVDAVDLSLKEITDTLVNFLAHYKLYLHHFSIIKQETYVSYKSPETESGKTLDLTYEPAYRRNLIFIDAEIQLEDGIDYFELLNIKIKEPIKSISGKELKELGYKFNDCGIHSFAILDDKSAKEYLK